VEQRKDTRRRDWNSRLEPRAGKLARVVLRGERISNDPDLLNRIFMRSNFAIFTLFNFRPCIEVLLAEVAFSFLKFLYFEFYQIDFLYDVSLWKM
jgi:hypothetical protein